MGQFSMKITPLPGSLLGGNQHLPALETYLGSRAAYVRMDREGLLGVIADKTPNRALAAHIQSAVKEAGVLLEEIDQLILNPAEVA